MKLKRIFACALALVFTASTIIARPASATDSEKNIDENQKIIYNKTNKKLTKSNGTCEKVYSDSTDEENAAEADTPDSEDSETEAAKATYDDDEIDEEIETPNKQIKELKDKIKVLR